MLGADTIFDQRLDGAAMLKAARSEGRIMARYPIDVVQNAFSRCARCNTLLIEVDREVVRRRVPPFVYANNERFSACPGCSHLYWNGTHRERIIREVREIGLASSAQNST